MNAFIRLLYSLLIAAAVVSFVGVAMYSAYVPPKRDYASYDHFDYSKASDAEIQQRDDRLRKDSDNYQQRERTYQRNVTYALVPLAIGFVLAGITMLRKKSEVIGEGLALGGVMIAVYSIFTASVSNNRLLRLAAVTLLLGCAIAVAQQRFSTKATKAK